MRELESSLQQFGEFLLKAQLARPAAAPYFVRWVRRFLSRPASDQPLADQVRRFCEELEQNGASEDPSVPTWMRHRPPRWRCSWRVPVSEANELERNVRHHAFRRSH